ncbi:hypothetical protein GQ44DRAFT_824892 [Phaeosphaeriaceae sp. PMI808]|nr:hypothetical protein GQ44DRAFT_824892 [Phaeosphaeriaceae sp. PMI808]
MPPSYGSQEYWDKRFASDSNPFEWLEAPHSLDIFLLDALKRSQDKFPKILHIGCGTSMLSHHLRTMIQEPDQIYNVDYSEIAVDLGKKRERELCDKDKQTTANGSDRFMHWDAVNLLNYKSLSNVYKNSTYPIIIDKSTSDSIACSDDVRISLPYIIDIGLEEAVSSGLQQSSELIHPLHVMAVHLALVTKPGALWIALSYSNDRFPFVNGLYSSRPHIHGFPDTGKLWKLQDKREVESVDPPTLTKAQDNKVTHKPRVFNWVYILERTEIPLFIRGAYI